VSFERLYALCQNARSLVNAPVTGATLPGISTAQAVDRLNMVNRACCEATPMRKFVYEQTVNHSNIHNNVYGAVIMAQPLR